MSTLLLSVMELLFETVFNSRVSSISAQNESKMSVARSIMDNRIK